MAIAFSLASALQLGSTLQISSLASSILRVGADGTVATTTLQSNLSLSGSTLSLASALTDINSVTAATATNLTLSGGSSGASLTLGQGTSASTTLLATTSGNINLGPNPGGTPFINITRDQDAETSLRVRNNNTGSSAYASVVINPNGNSWALKSGAAAANSNHLDFALDFTAPAIKARLTTAGNLLIGTTTDASSLAGGLVLNGSGAGATATSTTTGTLRVGGGAGISGSVYVGGSAYANALDSATFITCGTATAVSGVGGNIRYRDDTSTSRWLSGLLGTAAATSFTIYDSVNLAARITITSAATSSATVTINPTTASTSTTTGALVVSGGVGIAGALYTGGIHVTVASASGGAGFRLLHGAAPSSPVDGDVWTTTSGLFVRINGVTKTVTLT